MLELICWFSSVYCFCVCRPLRIVTWLNVEWSIWLWKEQYCQNKHNRKQLLQCLMVNKCKSNRTNISVQAYDAIVVELFPTVQVTSRCVCCVCTCMPTLTGVTWEKYLHRLLIVHVTVKQNYRTNVYRLCEGEVYLCDQALSGCCSYHVYLAVYL